MRSDWVAQSSVRGLSNWLHDRLWHHLATELDTVDGVHLVDLGPTREVIIGVRYRIRMKRHDLVGRVNTYPTQTALAFFEQERSEPTLDTLEEIRLIAGYEWDPDTREMGRAVLSLRDGQDNILWLVEIPSDGGEGTVDLIVPPVPGPTLPTITVPDEADETESE